MNGQRPRVLLVLLFQPWPVRNGITRRLSALAAALAAETDLRVLVTDQVSEGEVAPEGIRVGWRHRDASRGRSLLEVGRALAVLDPVTIGFYRRADLRIAIADAVREHHPDVVVTHGPGGAALVEGLVPAARTILDADTVTPESFRQIARETGGVRGLIWRLDAPLMTRWHRRHLDQLAAVTVVSPDDVATYAELAPRARVVCVPNGVELPETTRPDPGGARLLYLGDLRYPPNRAAVDWFAQDVLPQVPAAHLRVVGAGAVTPSPRVEHAGFVPELAPEWAAATALVVPVRGGGGTRLKVLEAMAAGVPVVSTALGAEGIDAVPGVHYIAAESVTEWVAALTRLLADAPLRRDLAAAARTHVEQFAWPRATRPLLDLVREVAQ